MSNFSRFFNPRQRVFNRLTLIMIIVGLATVVLSTLEYFSGFRFLLGVAGYITAGYFTVEYGSRIAYIKKHSGGRALRKYLFSFMGIVDLLAIMPFLLPAFFERETMYMSAAIYCRLVLIFKLRRYSQSIDMLSEAINSVRRPLLVAISLPMMVATVSAIFFYYIESPLHGDNLTTLGDAFYWVVITMTTVGYGDIAPVSDAGQLLAILTALSGVLVIAIPSGLLSSAFIKMLDKESSNSTKNHSFSRSRADTTHVTVRKTR